MNSQEINGLKKVVKQIKEDKIEVIKTDKSKKFSVDKPENYINDMMPHVQNKVKVDEKYVIKTITKCNGMSKSLVKVIGIGKSAGQQARAIKNVHVAPQTELPVMIGLHKDHKQGRHKRPLVYGNIGPISPLSSEIISDTLEGFVGKLREQRKR